MGKLLIDEHPLQVLPSLAVAIGLNEAVVLQQVHFWLRGAKENDALHKFKKGRWWVYNTYDEWRESNFPFWSTHTIRRAVTNLEDRHLLISDQLERGKYSRRKWYTIDYDEVRKLEVKQPSVQVGQIDESKLDSSNGPDWTHRMGQDGLLITESNTNTSTETIPETSSTPTDVGAPEVSAILLSPMEHPEAYTVADIQALDYLTKEQWQQLLENEQKGLSKCGIRSSVVKHAQGKINQHPLEPYMPAMLDAVDKATDERIDDPGMRAQFRRVIYDKLWQGAKPYMPEEVLRFAAENGPVESVYFLANALSRWRNKAARPQRASNIHPVQGSRPQIDTSSEAFKKEYGHYDRDDSVGYRD